MPVPEVRATNDPPGQLGSLRLKTIHKCSSTHTYNLTDSHPVCDTRELGNTSGTKRNAILYLTYKPRNKKHKVVALTKRSTSDSRWSTKEKQGNRVHVNMIRGKVR